MRLLVFLFVVGTIAIVALVFFELLGDRPMPWSCPRCHAGGDEDVVGRPRSWYRGLRDQRVQCRSCSTVFKEHPNGSLVEDPDG